MKQKIEIKLSDIFHLAADKYLKICSDNPTGDYQYSCTAIRKALSELLQESSSKDQTKFFILRDKYLKIIKKGLVNMGLFNPDTVTKFREFESPYHEPTEQSQGARYAWLKFCALMAEEQGV